VITAELALAWLCLLLAGMAAAMMWELWRHLRALRAAAVELQLAAAAATTALDAMRLQLRARADPDWPFGGTLGTLAGAGAP
jgi:hypothetical protein